MIKSQRHLFNIPDDVAYLNTAYMSPLLNSVIKATDEGARLKSQPWRLTIPDFYEQVDKARLLFSKIINVNPQNLAIVPSTSYGIQTAVNNLMLGEKKKIILIENQFPSNVYPWKRLANKSDCFIKFIETVENETITDSILKEMDESCAVVAVPNVTWTSGKLIDLIALRKRCDDINCFMVLDLTQSAGAMQIDFKQVRPDFAVVSNYKWMLGPYSTGFLYASPENCFGEPLEEGWITRKDSKNFSNLVNYTDHYEPGAVRYDMGERSNFALMPGVIKALEQILEWGINNIEETLKVQNTLLSERLENIGLTVTPEGERGPHFIGAKLPKKHPKNLLRLLEKENIFLSERGGFLRITPHLWNNENDFNKLVSSLSRKL